MERKRKNAAAEEEADLFLEENETPDEELDTEEDEAAGAKAEAEFNAGAEEKPKRQRRSRPKKTEPAPGLSTMGLTLPATPAKSAVNNSAPANEEPAIPGPARARARSPKTPPLPPAKDEKAPITIAAPSETLPSHPLDKVAPDQLQKDVSIANVADIALEHSMDSMVKQWGSVKDISHTIAANLEKVTKLLTEQTADLQVLRAPTAKASPIARWAIGASLMATVLSVVSLSLSQTARQEVLNKEPSTSLAKNVTTAIKPALNFPNFGSRSSRSKDLAKDLAKEVVNAPRAETVPLFPSVAASQKINPTVNKPVMGPFPRVASTTRSSPVQSKKNSPVVDHRVASRAAKTSTPKRVVRPYSVSVVSPEIAMRSRVSASHPRMTPQAPLLKPARKLPVETN